MPKICPRYAKDMHEICPRYAQDMPKICQIYAQDMHEICPRYAKDMPEICPRYTHITHLGAYYQFLGACFYWGNIIIFTLIVWGQGFILQFTDILIEIIFLLVMIYLCLQKALAQNMLFTNIQWSIQRLYS